MLEPAVPEEPLDHSIAAAIAFWKDAGPDRWFKKDEAFDGEFRSRFLCLHESAAKKELDAWAESPEGCLALLILLDQFPRNAFRNTERMYATDALARHYADRALKAHFDERTSQDLRLFFYLPFAHSENIEDQDRSVALHERLGLTSHAYQHRDVIKRFGRFPHRNQILGRVSTDDERAFLEDGGFSG